MRSGVLAVALSSSLKGCGSPSAILASCRWGHAGRQIYWTGPTFAWLRGGWVKTRILVLTKPTSVCACPSIQKSLVTETKVCPTPMEHFGPNQPSSLPLLDKILFCKVIPEAIILTPGSCLKIPETVSQIYGIPWYLDMYRLFFLFFLNCKIEHTYRRVHLCEV